MNYKNKKLLNALVFLTTFALILLPNFVAFADSAEGEIGTPTPVPTEQTTTRSSGGHTNPFPRSLTCTGGSEYDTASLNRADTNRVIFSFRRTCAHSNT